MIRVVVRWVGGWVGGRECGLGDGEVVLKGGCGYNSTAMLMYV